MGRAGLQALLAKATSSLRPRQQASTSIGLSSSHGGQYNRTLRLLSIVFLTFLLLLSTAALILKANTFSFIEMNREMGFFLESSDPNVDPTTMPLVAALPSHLYRVSEKIILVTAGINILLSMGHLGLIGINWKTVQRTQTPTFRRNTMMLHLLNSCILLVAMVSIFLTNSSSSRFRGEDIPTKPNALSPTGYPYYRYEAGTFDLETWTCELKEPEAVGMAREDYARQCAIEHAGKAIMVPLFTMALAVAGVSIWGFMSRSKVSTGDQQLWTKDLELEMGKVDSDHKTAKVEEVELQPTDVATRPKDGRLSKIEEDESEEAEEPVNKSVEENKSAEADKSTEADKSAEEDKSKPASDSKPDSALKKPDATS